MGAEKLKAGGKDLQTRAGNDPARNKAASKRYVAPKPRKKAPAAPPQSSSVCLADQAAIAANVLARERAYCSNAVQHSVTERPAPQRSPQQVQPHQVAKQVHTHQEALRPGHVTKHVYTHNQVPGLSDWLPPQQQAALLPSAAPPPQSQPLPQQPATSTNPHAYVPLPAAPVPWPAPTFGATSLQLPSQAAPGHLVAASPGAGALMQPPLQGRHLVQPAPVAAPTYLAQPAIDGGLPTAVPVALGVPSVAPETGVTPQAPREHPQPTVLPPQAAPNPIQPPSGAQTAPTALPQTEQAAQDLLAAPPQRTSVRMHGPHVPDTCPFATDSPAPTQPQLPANPHVHLYSHYPDPQDPLNRRRGQLPAAPDRSEPRAEQSSFEAWGASDAARQQRRSGPFMGALTELKAGPTAAQRAHAERVRLQLKADLETQVHPLPPPLL